MVCCVYVVSFRVCRIFILEYLQLISDKPSHIAIIRLCATTRHTHTHKYAINIMHTDHRCDAD